MRWAVEIQKTNLERRNLADLLVGLGFKLKDGDNYFGLWSPKFEKLNSAKDVWTEAKKIRNVFTGPASIDPEFTLGAVLEYSPNGLKQHVYLEPESTESRSIVGSPNTTFHPPADLTPKELKKWKANQEELEYQSKLERQREKFEPVYLEPRASKVLELLSIEDQTGETLYKAYEVMELHPNNRGLFQEKFNVSKNDFKRFGDAVHNPSITGDFARHAYNDNPRSDNPMSITEAETFIRKLAKEWLASIRHSQHIKY